MDSLSISSSWTTNGSNIYSTGTNNVGIGTTLPVTKLQIPGSIIFGRTAVADTNYTATASDYIIAYTSLSASRTITLPTAICTNGKVLDIVDESGNANSSRTITIDPEGSTTILGQTTFSLNAGYNSVMIYCNGSNWRLY